jgi:pyruvate/2-oxoglutarate dehydrogenase complex dihydrolipoamide acyltransferase (E2) component
MAIDVKLPELGDGIDSGDVLDVLVKEGDTIAKDQAICELETEKATVEVPSSHAGKVVKVHIAAGQNVPIGATLVSIEAVESDGGEAPAAKSPADQPAQAGTEQTATTAETPPQPAPDQPAPSAGAPSAAPAPQAAPAAPAPADGGPQAPAQATTEAEPTRPAAPAQASAPQSPPQAQPQAATPRPQAPQRAESPAPAGPAIRRLAREVGIDLRQLTGTGNGGRITRDDVLAAVRRGAAAPPPASPQPAAAGTNGESAAVQTPTTTTASTSDNWGPIRVERMTRIRSTIAGKMSDSWLTVPRVTNFDDADVTELERIRQASKGDYADRGIKLTNMAFVIKAVALALRNNPMLNASIDEENEQIIYKQYINIGIAVDTERGLIVPSLRRPDELRIPDIARALSNIADNARNNNFKLEDLRGSTFTISNLGAVGGTYSTPIVNVPEVAILLIGRSRRQPMMTEDDKMVPRLMMPLSLSYDHRLVDGATAARFLNGVIEYLENPSRLLIAP